MGTKDDTMNEPAKYPLAMRLVHWLMAVMILCMIGVGWFMTPYDETREPMVGRLYFWHKSFGLLVFILVTARLGMRLRSVIPELPQGLPSLDRKLARMAHVLLYTLVFVMPILGYVLSSSYEYSSGVHFFVVDLPEVIPDNETIFNITDLLHMVLGYTLLVVILMHLSGALKHRFFDSERENDVLSRML